MKQQQFPAVYKGEKRTVFGRRCGKYFYIHGHKGAWTLAHASTGYAIAFPSTIKACREIVTGLLALDIDWARNSRHFFQSLSKEMKRSVHDVIYDVLDKEDEQ